jgi:hypothetical protein
VRPAGLRLPRDIRFAAGLLHEDRTLDQLRTVVSAVEDALGRPVSLAAWRRVQKVKLTSV